MRYERKKMIYQEVNENLIAYVNENTKSVRLMDNFEGIEGGRRYKKIIVKTPNTDINFI